MSTHPESTPITRAAYKYINEYNWTLVAVGLDKRPLGQWSEGGANRYNTTNLELVTELANAPGIAVVTGPSSIVTIDVDNKPAYDAWIARFGEPKTRIAKTPRGRHFHYKAPPGIPIGPATEIMPGIDLRGGESYAILPPSILAGEYAWANDKPILALPQEILELLQDSRPQRKEKILSGDAFSTGSRNDHLFSMAKGMRDAGFDQSSILAAITETNKTRCDPPLPAHEVADIAQSVMRYDIGLMAGIDQLTRLRAAAATEAEDALPQLAANTEHLPVAWLVDDPVDEIDWVWKGFLAPGTLSMLHGEGGLGKSWIALKIAEQMLTPDGSLLDAPVNTGPVIFLDGENAKSQIHSRIKYTKIPNNADLSYYMVNDPILGLEEHSEKYIDYLIEKHKPRLIIIDSQRALWSGDEREQNEAGKMLRRWARSIEEHPCAYLLIHHDNRSGDYSGSSDINAAISGCRLHLQRHPDKDKPEARIITQPKNRIAREMPRQEFLLNIVFDTDPTVRKEFSGVKIDAYESDEQKIRLNLLESAQTYCIKLAKEPHRKDGIIKYKEIRDIAEFAAFNSRSDKYDNKWFTWFLEDIRAAGWVAESSPTKDQMGSGPGGSIIVPHQLRT